MDSSDIFDTASQEGEEEYEEELSAAEVVLGSFIPTCCWEGLGWILLQMDQG